jgi:hypothetical protein
MSLDAPSAERREVPYRESAKRGILGDPSVVDLEVAPEGRSFGRLDDDVLHDALGRETEWTASGSQLGR